MKTISDYTIYCTESQTRKAMELGALIIKVDTQDKRLRYYDNLFYPIIADYPFAIPTAEQMRGWLEDIFHIQIDVTFRVIDYDWSVRDMYDTIISQSMHVESRKEATFAAIDAALEYLTKNKK